MTRRNAARWTTIGLVVLATTTAGAVVSPSGRHRIASAASTSPEARRPWIVLEAGRDVRSLVIRYKDATCPDGPGRARLRETSKQIAIAVMQKSELVDPGKPCVRMAVITRLVVHLRHPIAGRHIAGEGYPWRLRLGSVDYLAKSVADPPHPAIELPLVPRVVGLSASEATAVLHREGFHVKRINATAGEITTQSPTRGHLAPGSTRRSPYAGRVTLTVGP